MPNVPAGVKIAVGIFATETDQSVVFKDPSGYTLSIASEAPAGTDAISLAQAPSDGVITDGTNTHSFAKGDTIWILSALPAGEDAEIAVQGLDVPLPNLSLTTVAATDASATWGTFAFAPGL